MGKKILFSILSLVIGAVVGLVGVVYFTLPLTDVLTVGETLYYTNAETTITSDPIAFTDGELSIHFPELGNKYTGDCTYIKYGDLDILIDCGSKTNSVSAVSAYLNQYVTDNTLEYVIVTHAHTDHYAGFTLTNGSIFDLYNCTNIIDFGSAYQTETKTLEKYISERDAELALNGTDGLTYSYYDASEITEGNNLKFYSEDNALEIEILYNEMAYNRATGNGSNSTSNNEYSVCTLITFNEEQHFLFTGDLEEEGEESLVQNNPSIQRENLPNGVDLYKAGHHGSKTSSNDCLLEQIRPQLVCVCCCAGSSEYTDTYDNQFPTQEFINRISAYTDAVYVTTLCVNWDTDEFTSMNGNIVAIFSSSADTRLVFSNNDTKLKDSEWFNSTRPDGEPMRVWPETSINNQT